MHNANTMASSQQNNYSSIPQRQQQQQVIHAQAAPTAPDNTSAPAAAADGANLGYMYYSTESIQQAGQAYASATAATMGTNSGSSFGGGVSAGQQPAQAGGVHVPPTAAAAVPQIPAQYMGIGASVPAPPVPAQITTNPNEQLTALMAATAAMQQTKAQQINPTTNTGIVAMAGDQHWFGLADQGSVIAAGLGNTNAMAPQIPQQMQHVQYEQGSQVMKRSAAVEDAETPAAVVGGQQPTYVNAKQYSRILKRREARALIEEIYSIKRQRLEYKHESRHCHALKRPRDKTGRFLTKGELVEYYKEHPEEDPKRLKGGSGG